MTKPDYKKELQKEIANLEVKAAERKKYCMNNVHASNYDEVSGDYRAIMLKIDAKIRQLKHMDSSIEVLERSVRISPGV
ncbi:MAG: hypothetical protein KAS32_02030 [Candidatus Peribacteraceae bacterium]|nr:hypothetical protein [Candidatus Peribacteraceae bacterium]